ncbi:MAG: DNA polymerase III subunit gamma/tau [Myxococcota bacterium]|nr:DNA polymerase III subunit gamma/tau [Myxococcota bacterium]
MSYQAIARKWRPTTFAEICGQGHVTRTLTNALELGRIHHAFLFTGARGVGKTTAARTMARCLNCHKGPTPTPCGECPSCLDIGHGSSPDVTEIDGASNNSVEDVRGLRDAVRYLPSRDKYRVYIIDEVHMLSIGAFNALLKTLEEPPDHVVFIFATTEPQKIPDTILSRVQRFDFKRIPTTVVVGRLRTIVDAENIEIPDDGLRLIARAGEGSMRDAQSLLDQVIAFGGDKVDTAQVAQILGLVDRGLLYGFLEGLTQGKPELCLDSIAQVYDYGYELSQFTSELLELLRNAALAVLSPAARKHIDAPAEELQRLETLCKGQDAETFSRWFQVMLAVHDEVSRSSRPRLVLEMAVARLALVRPVQPLGHLVQRLEGLERTMRQGGVRPNARSGGRAPRGGHSNGGHPNGGHGGPDDAPSGRGGPRGPQAQLSSVSSPAPARLGPQATAHKLEEVSRGPHLVELPPPPPEPVSPEQAPPPEPTSEDMAGAFEPQEFLSVPPPEPLPDALNDEARYQALLAWLAPQRVRYWSAAESTALLGVENNVLHIVAPGPAAVKRFESLRQDADLLEAIGILFPGVTALKASLRKDADSARLTRRELRAKMLADHKAMLIAEAKEDTVILRVQKELDAHFVDLIPLSEPEGLP